MAPMDPAAPAVYLPRTCPWCDAAATDPTREVCGNCAGPLPAPMLAPQPVAPTPGASWDQMRAQALAAAQASRGPGPAPGPPPRQLPSTYVNRVLYWRNVFFILGFVFTVFLFWTLIFPAIGIPLWIHGHRRARRELRALQEGQVAQGQITGVQVDHSTTINNRHPWVVAYAFATPRGTRQGTDQGFDSANGYRMPGDPVWVVYVDDDPDCSAVWPPVR
jgi:hypothetical protein